MVELREELRLALEADDRERLENIIEEADPEDFQTLEELVRDEESSSMHRRRAIYALGKWPDREDRAVNVIESVLPELTELERITALSTLGRIGTPEAREIIVQYRDDESPDVRRQVVIALSRVKDETAIEELHELAEKDETEFVRELAQEKLEQLEKP